MNFSYQKDATLPTTTHYISSQILATIHLVLYHSLVFVPLNYDFFFLTHSLSAFIKIFILQSLIKYKSWYHVDIFPNFSDFFRNFKNHNQIKSFHYMIFLHLMHLHFININPQKVCNTLPIKFANFVNNTLQSFSSPMTTKFALCCSINIANVSKLYSMLFCLPLKASS